MFKVTSLHSDCPFSVPCNSVEQVGQSVSLVTRLTWTTRGPGSIPGGGPLCLGVQAGCGMHPASLPGVETPAMKFCTVTPNILYSHA